MAEPQQPRMTVRRTKRPASRASCRRKAITRTAASRWGSSKRASAPSYRLRAATQRPWRRRAPRSRLPIAGDPMGYALILAVLSEEAVRREALRAQAVARVDLAERLGGLLSPTTRTHA